MLSCGGLYLTRGFTLHPLLTRLVPWAVARVAPLELTIGRIEGDWRRRVALYDVTLVERGDPRTVEQLSLARLEVRGAILRLARGRLDALDRVEVAGVRGTLDVRTTSDAEFRAAWPPLAALPALALEGGALVLITDGGAVALDALRLSGPRNGPYAVAGEVGYEAVRGRAALELSLADEGRTARVTGTCELPGWTTFAIEGALDGRGGTLHDAPLDLRAVATLDEARPLEALDPRLRRFEGRGRAEVALFGPLSALVVGGEVALADGRIRAAGLPDLDAVDLALALREGRIDVLRATAEVGAAPVRITGGSTLGDGAALGLRLTGENVLLARSNDARVRADLDLRVSGPMAAPVIEGQVALVGSRLRLEVDLLGALDGALPRRRASSGAPRRREGLELPALGPPGGRLDVALVTREAVRVQGNVARGALRADLRLVGDTALPMLVGQVFVDPLELALPAGTVRFASGAVRFTADRPNVPQLELVGETRIAGHDVQVELAGTYDAPEVRLSSTPPLSADQLVLLVVSGRPPSEAGQLSAAGESLAVWVAKDLVRGWFDDGGFDDRKSFLSRIEVVTGREVSKSGVLTLEATYLVRERVVGRDGGVYGVLERDAYEDYNLGLRFLVRLR